MAFVLERLSLSLVCVFVSPKKKKKKKTEEKRKKWPHNFGPKEYISYLFTFPFGKVFVSS